MDALDVAVLAGNGRQRVRLSGADAMKHAGVFDGDLTKTMYKSELVKAFESKTEDPVYGQRDREGSHRRRH